MSGLYTIHLLLLGGRGEKIIFGGTAKKRNWGRKVRSIHTSLYLSDCLSIYLSFFYVYLSVFLSIFGGTAHPIHQSIFLSVCIYISIYLSVCLSRKLRKNGGKFKSNMFLTYLYGLYGNNVWIYNVYFCVLCTNTKLLFWKKFYIKLPYQ